MFHSKSICILTAGATIDGRFIEQKVIDDIAVTYNPERYNARINANNHKRSIRYGSVLSVEKRGNQLFAVLQPNSALLETIEKGQLLHTYCEVDPDFAGTGRSYLTGLALTDEPASLGTTQMHLSVDHADNAKQVTNGVNSAGKPINLSPQKKKELEAKVDKLEAQLDTISELLSRQSYF